MLEVGVVKWWNITYQRTGNISATSDKVTCPCSTFSRHHLKNLQPSS